MLEKGQTIELEITGLAFGGKGIAKPNGLTVFVDQALPGDRVCARIAKKKKRYVEAKMVRLLSPSPHRVDPPCPYSGCCGGCRCQFLAYDMQLAYKRRHVEEALVHIGGIRDALVNPVLPAKSIFAYRNKMEFSCTDRRWLLPEEMERGTADAGFALGLHAPGTFYKVVDIDACLLQPPEGNQILTEVKQYMKHSGLPPYGLRSHEGFWRFLVLRHSQARDQWLVNILTASENLAAVKPLAALLSDRHPAVVSVVNNVTARKSGVAVGEYELLLAGERCLKERLGRYEFEVSANSFFQTNTRGAEVLYDTVRRYAELSGTETVLDLYSGTGTIPIWLSDAAAKVTGIEVVESAVADAEKNCRRNGISNCRFIAGDIRRVLSGIAQRPDVLVIDPPRAGMHKDVVQQVLAMAPKRIVYVSCNPASLARDAALMKADYRVVEVQPVDMFPHTYHIESVARMEKNERK